MMKLYSIPLSPFAARVRGAIYAKGLDIAVVAPPADWRTSAAYRALNPMVRIPVLVVDDATSIPESGVIVEYLEDAFPARSLRPTKPVDLARVRLVTQVADLYVMQAILPIFGLFDTKDRDRVAIEAQWSKLRDGLAKLEAMLPMNGYAHGDRPTTADVWLTPLRFTLDGLMGFTGQKDLLDAFPRIGAYREVARRDEALGRVWSEMEEGLVALMKQRAEAKA
jgi:glutathione S-transferase